MLLPRLVQRATCARLGVRASLGTASEAPKFDEAMAKAYKRIAENHRHARGPWGLMRDAVVAHCGASPSVLDIASGPGEPAITIAKALPGARVVASDVSEDMVASAAAATAAAPNVESVLADAQDLAYGDATFDAVTCCYGYMFPTDKALALAETRRVLVPGGVLVATTWDRVDLLKISRDVMEAVLGEAPPKPPLDPMSLSEPGLFASMVADAGFADVTQTTSTYPFNFGSDPDFQFTCGTIVVKQMIDQQDDPDAAWARARTAFFANIGKYAAVDASGDLIMPENTFRLTIAK